MDIPMSMEPMKDIRKNHTVVMSLTVTRPMFMKVKITKVLLREEKEQEDRGHKVVIMLEERRKRADVIIPVYRPDEKLKQLLEGLRKQTHLAEHNFSDPYKDRGSLVRVV